MPRWLDAEAASERMGVKLQTLYANVSRGRLRSKPDPKRPGRSLFNAEDVDRLAARRAGRRPTEVIAAQTIQWGDPVLSSSITQIDRERLFYRGRDAVDLSVSSTFEETCAILWETKGEGDQRLPGRPRRRVPSPFGSALDLLARRAARDLPCRGRAAAVLIGEGAALVDEIAEAMSGSARTRRRPGLHDVLAGAWRAPQAADALRRALVLLADHELNASTFATRVAVSTGAPLAAGLLAGMVTLAGPLHGGAASALQSLVDTARRSDVVTAVAGWLRQGNPLPAVGHPLYPSGDPRASALLGSFAPSALYADLATEMQASSGELPNIDFALAAMADRFHLPSTAPFVTFAVARSAGWVAHAVEQALTGELIRPRARYTGLAPPETAGGPAALARGA